jgi:hypothetical protein
MEMLEIEIFDIEKYFIIAFIIGVIAVVWHIWKDKKCSQTK